MAAERSIVTLGGKGSSLSSSSVYKVASSVANVRIDTSAIERLATKSRPSIKRSSFGISEGITKEETRASLVVILNKLLLSNSGPPSLPEKILEILNSKGEKFESGEIEVTELESVVLEKSCASLIGISSIIDHKSTLLTQIVDSIAALSCEATKGDISSFSSWDLGDGFGFKDAIAVASDLKVLLNGSKAVGKTEIEDVSKIPGIHGTFRDVVKSLHSVARGELNTGVKGGKTGSGNSGNCEALGSKLLPLLKSIKSLGKCSFLRAKMCFTTIENEILRNGLSEVFEKSCVEYENLKSSYNLAYGYGNEDSEEEYCKFAHELNQCLDIVWRLVGLEAVAAFFALAGGELIVEKSGDAAEKEESSKTDKKKNKKEKKAVLGKGTSLLIQFIKERLVSNEVVTSVEYQIKSLNQWVEQISNLFNLEGHDFDCFLAKVKEILESNENRRLPKLPKGTRDFANEQMIVRKRAFAIIERVFEKHGATALDTPVFELRETLMGKYGEDSKLIYDIADQGGELYSLRYDLTVPFARYVAMNGLTSFKRYQIAKVYRRDNPSKGRYREFYQCDFDIAGLSEPMGPDFEVVKILTELLEKLEIGDFEVKLNHRKLLDGMLEICGVPAEKFRTICSSIDKLDKQSFEQVKTEMVVEKGLSPEVADKIGKYVGKKGALMDLWTELDNMSEFKANPSSKEALEELKIMFNALERSRCSHRISFDLSLARGLDYYTGVIFEAVCKGTEVGSIAAGGRYDNLIGMFGKRQVPAIGVSLGIERVFTILEAQQNAQQKQVRATKTQVLASVLMDNKLGEAADLVSQLWEADINAEYLGSKRRAKHFDRAKDSGIPWMVIVGERELNEGVVTLKNIVTGIEEEVPRADLVEELLRRL